MNRYQTSIPRLALGAAAVAMTAITIGLLVVLPAKMDSDSRESPVLAASKVVAAPASVGVDAGPLRIDVVAVREPRSAGVPCLSSNATAIEKMESAYAPERPCPHSGHVSGPTMAAKPKSSTTC